MEDNEKRWIKAVEIAARLYRVDEGDLGLDRTKILETAKWVYNLLLNPPN
jgi:hypothetical protein